MFSTSPNFLYLDNSGDTKNFTGSASTEERELMQIKSVYSIQYNY